MLKLSCNKLELKKKLMTISSGEITARGRNGATCLHILAIRYSFVRQKVVEGKLKMDFVTTDFIK
jgi:hypothetical protein